MDFQSEGYGSETRGRYPRRRGATTRKRRGFAARGGRGRHVIHCVHTVRLRIGTRSGGSCVKPRGRPTPRGHWIHEGMYDRCQRQQGPVPAHSVILCACQRQPPSNPAPLLEGTIGSGTTWSAAWLRRCQHCSRPDDRHGLLGLMDKASDF